jgi:hypothetical protein
MVITTAIGAASFLLSFATLCDLAARAGAPPRLAWLWPVIVDGTIVQATVSLLALAAYPAQRRNRGFFWTVLIAAAMVSIGSNALHAVVPKTAPLNPWLAAAVASVAPISLIATTHGLAVLIRARHTPPVPPNTTAATAARIHSATAGPDPSDDRLHGWESIAATLRQRQLTTQPLAAVADVLRYTYDQPDNGKMSQRAIARRVGMGVTTVGKIQTQARPLVAAVLHGDTRPADVPDARH